MTLLQTIALFASGYLLSRLLLRAEAHLAFLRWLLRRAGGRVAGLVLGFMIGAFLLSTFVPNALTVLALIPVIKLLRERLGPDSGLTQRDLATILTIGLVYGANMGGIASLIGSPANLYFIVSLGMFEVPGRESIHFVSWLLFGFPVAAALLLASWGLLLLTERRTMTAGLGDSEALLPAGNAPLFRTATRVSVAWLVVWFGIIAAGLLLGAAPLFTLTIFEYKLAVAWLDLIAIGLTLAFAGALFLGPAGDGPLLRMRDLGRDLPMDGLYFGGLVLLLLYLVAKTGLVGHLGRVMPSLIPGTATIVVTLLVLALITIYATEVVSNTTVALVLFPVALLTARQMGGDPLLFMLTVSLASTCAFMTPIATPVNAIAFAGVGKVSLGRFLKTGAIVNLVGAILLAVWLTWVAPSIIALFR